MGIAPDYTLDFNEVSGILIQHIHQQIHYILLTPDGYEHIETGKGTSRNDKNFITIKPGPLATETFKMILKLYQIHILLVQFIMRQNTKTS